MDLTEGTIEEKNERSKRMMLWFGIGSLIMTFAGLTSAYVVSRKREDWDVSVELPQMFIWSTFIIICSSVTYYLAKRSLKNEEQGNTTMFLGITLALGIAFIILQFLGFNEMITVYGYRFTGETSTIKMSFIYMLAAVHILHVVAGIISLIVVTVNQVKGKYSAGKMLGFEQGSTFWHFLDILWVYLILFMYFVK